MKHTVSRMAAGTLALLTLESAAAQAPSLLASSPVVDLAGAATAKSKPTVTPAAPRTATLSASVSAAPAVPQQATCPPLAAKPLLLKARQGHIKALLSVVGQLRAQLTPGTRSAGCADAGMEQLWTLYWKCMRAYEQSHSSIISRDEISPEKTVLKQELAQVGWYLEISEAGNFVYGDTAWLLKRLGPGLPASWQSYLSQQKEQARLTEDAALQIPRDALRQRLVFWERFVQQYPAFPLRTDIQGDMDTYLGMWLLGTANSAITDSETKILLPELRRSFEKFLRENRDSQYFPLLQEYYQLLAAKKFRPSKASAALLKKHNVQSFEDSQPPMY